MDVQLRDSLKQSVNDVAKKYQLDDITYGSFVAQFGYKTKVACNSKITLFRVNDLELLIVAECRVSRVACL